MLGWPTDLAAQEAADSCEAYLVGHWSCLVVPMGTLYGTALSLLQRHQGS